MPMSASARANLDLLGVGRVQLAVGIATDQLGAERLLEQRCAAAQVRQQLEQTGFVEALRPRQPGCRNAVLEVHTPNGPIAPCHCSSRSVIDASV